MFGACQRQRPRSIPARLVVVPLDVALVDLDAVGVDVLRPAVVRHRGGVLDVEHDPPDFVRRPAGAPRRRTAGVALDPALNQADGSHPNETATVGLRSSRGRRQGTASTPRGARWPVGGAVPQRAGVAAPCAGGASIPASTTSALAPCAGRMIASGAAVIERMSPRRRPSLAPSASTTTCARRASAPATHPAASAAVAPARAVVVTSARTRSSPRTVRAPPGTPPRRRSRFPRPASRRSSAARVRRPRSPRSTGLSSPRASPICPARATRSPRATSTRPGSPRRVRSGSPCRWRSLFAPAGAGRARRYRGYAIGFDAAACFDPRRPTSPGPAPRLLSDRRLHGGAPMRVVVAPPDGPRPLAGSRPRSTRSRALSAAAAFVAWIGRCPKPSSGSRCSSPPRRWPRRRRQRWRRRLRARCRAVRRRTPPRTPKSPAKPS